MSFKNLETRFNEKVNQLYTGAKYKFDNGRVSSGANDDPLIVRKPGDGYWGFGEGRGTPIRSAAQDVKRLTLFTASVRGIAFLAKQQLLQTGNTFEAQRVINPLFAIGNAVPFLHTKRSLDIPVTARGIGRQLLGDGALASRIFGSGKQQNALDNLRKIGQLQSETYNKLAGTPPSGVSFLKKIPVIGQTISAFSAKRSVGDITTIPFSESRPELKNYVAARFSRADYTFKFGGTVQKVPKYGAIGANWNGNYTTYLKITDQAKSTSGPPAAERSDYSRPVALATNITPTDADTARSVLLSQAGLGAMVPKHNEVPTLSSQTEIYLETIPTEGDIYGTKADIKIPYLKYFVPSTEAGVSEQDRQGVILGAQDAQPKNAKTLTGNNKTVRYLRDKLNRPANGPDEGNPAGTRLLSAYNDLRAVKSATNGEVDVGAAADDPILVSFAMGRDSHVQFRAFIKDLQQTATPQYKDYQYIGRIEKFISYISVQREVSFKLGIIAFSQDELDIVWKRINYLTGMVFPYGVQRGILQPNIIRMTIGRVYVDQPAYVTGLSTNFNDHTESWDIAYNKQVPIGASMDLRFNLIEKRRAVADTSFYGITEGLGGFINAPINPTTDPTT